MCRLLMLALLLALVAPSAACAGCAKVTSSDATLRVYPSAKAQRTQWCAQFLAASELVRLGYVVSFTMGNNTPTADLMVGVPGRSTVLGRC